MKDGFVSVAAITPDVRVADVDSNVAAIVASVKAACKKGAKIVVTPELGVTCYTCEDLFWQDALLTAAERAIAELADKLSALDAIVFVGAPVRVNAKLYDCAIALSGGEVLGVVPKRTIPMYNDLYEGRHFTPGPSNCVPIDFAGAYDIPFGARQLFVCDAMPDLVIAAEVGEDLWAPNPPSTQHALAGATVIVNLAAEGAVVGKAAACRNTILAQSSRLLCAYLFSSAGWGESTTDAVFAGQDLVAEKGRLLAEAKPFGKGVAATEVDVALLAAERRRVSTFRTAPSSPDAGYAVTRFELERTETRLTRFVNPAPFVPSDAAERAARCEEVFDIQAHALARRLDHTHSTHAIIGVSGGLDSTLALLVAVRAFDLLDLDRSGIIAITMPGFGTTHRTHDNATMLADALGVDLREISIADSVRQHFYDIDHDENVHDATYENAQARERTQILMDLANQEGGLVVGTGDLSELALGWATYNGDHMSMYGVNASIPKTLVRHLVRYVADTCNDEDEASVLYDVLDTPVSPELLPAQADGTIAQKTEDLVGPYELHDFFIFEALRRGSSPRKVFRLARHAWGKSYDEATILKWLRTFYRRFFSQQFKRSCSPDGPKVGSVAASPRGDLRMPSDAISTLWLKELDEL